MTSFRSCDMPYFFPADIDVTRHNEYGMLNLLADVLNNGRRKKDRTGTGTISVFGRMLRYDLTKGWPLPTTKKQWPLSVAHELLWFLSGSTNNQYLTDNKVGIWNKWALTAEHLEQRELTLEERTFIYCIVANCTEQQLADKVRQLGGQRLEDEIEESDNALDDAISSYLDDNNIPELGDTLHELGDLGPIYGKQWRNWTTPDGGEGIDQIAYVVQTLKTNPHSRRMLVSAWNPADLPDERDSPHQNVLNGKQALAPCHTIFQMYTDEATLDERTSYVLSRAEIQGFNLEAAAELRTLIELNKDMPEEAFEKMVQSWHDVMRTPKYRLSCMLTQRSLDTVAASGYNAASYALLTLMIAQCTDMLPGEFIHSVGDCHIYLNHIDAVRKQLSRHPFSAPNIRLNPTVKDLFAFTIDDIEVLNYQHHPAIPIDIAV